jgi:UTP--glucose-1-phosphate uridylyltransferase
MSNPTKPVRKVVLPVAGLGTRFLPATKTIPKEMLPIVDIPTVQLNVEECIASGIEEIIFVTARGKSSIEDHFDRNGELEALLEKRGKTADLESIQRFSKLAKFVSVRQAEPRGLGHAVLCAKAAVGDEPFAVLLGDDLIDRADPLLRRMLEVRQQYGGSIIALMEVEPDQVSAYGCAAMKPTAEEDVVVVTDLVEKPPPGEAPSNWIIIGRYVCDPAVFGVLRHTPPGRGGEIQLTDALRTLATDGDGPVSGGGVHGVLFRGRRFDTGNKLDYLRTLVQFGCERPDLAEEFVPWLRTYLDTP